MVGYSAASPADLPGATLIPFNQGEILRQRPVKAMTVVAHCAARTTVQIQQDGVVGMATTNAYELVEATEFHEPGFVDSTAFEVVPVRGCG